MMRRGGAQCTMDVYDDNAHNTLLSMHGVVDINARSINKFEQLGSHDNYFVVCRDYTPTPPVYIKDTYVSDIMPLQSVIRNQDTDLFNKLTMYAPHSEMVLICKEHPNALRTMTKINAVMLPEVGLHTVPKNTYDEVNAITGRLGNVTNIRKIR